MTGCVLRVLGENFIPCDFLAGSCLPVSRIFRKGEVPIGRSKPSAISGFNCDVSASDANFPEQLMAAQAFLEHYSSELARVASFPGVDQFFLDFSHECRLSALVIAQQDFLPRDFLRIAGDLGLSICLTLLPPFVGNRLSP